MTAQNGPRFVAYYRVSTDKQGRSGLGLDAQRAAVARHAASAGGVVAAAFEEVESGRRGDRPQLGLALAECRLRRAVLLIAKLDRLARDAHFLLGLEKAGVEFLAADMPHANRLTVGIMALVAEEEARATSARTKAALAAAKARGVKLGNPQLRPGDSCGGTGGLVGRHRPARGGGPALSRRGKEGRSHHAAAVGGRAHRPRGAHAAWWRGLAALAGSARSGPPVARLRTAASARQKWCSQATMAVRCSSAWRSLPKDDLSLLLMRRLLLHSHQRKPRRRAPR
jgi:hypothetical protein